MSKSNLAAGASTAAIRVEGADEFIHDLKTLTASEMVAKYEMQDIDYDTSIMALNEGKHVSYPLREKPAPKVTTITTNPFKATVTIPEKVHYSAEAKGDNVLVIRVEREHSSQLIIPESAKTKSDIGRVTAIGPDVKRCVKGDLILFDKFASHGKEIDLVDDQGIPRQHLLLNDVDVLLSLKRSAVASDPS